MICVVYVGTVAIGGVLDAADESTLPLDFAIDCIFFVKLPLDTELDNWELTGLLVLLDVLEA